MMSVVVVTPSVHALDMDLVKEHLRVDFTDDDELIAALMNAAAAHIDGPQGWLGRSIWPQTLELRQNVFCGPVRLPYGPVQSVTSVKYVDGAGAEQTMDAAAYVLTGNGEVDRAYGTSWPAVRGDAEGVRIRYAAGFEDLPPSILAAVLMMISHWYSNREAVATGQTAQEMPLAVQALLAPFRQWAI